MTGIIRFPRGRPNKVTKPPAAQAQRAPDSNSNNNSSGSASASANRQSLAIEQALSEQQQQQQLQQQYGVTAAGSLSSEPPQELIHDESFFNAAVQEQGGGSEEAGGGANDHGHDQGHDHDHDHDQGHDHDNDHDHDHNNDSNANADEAVTDSDMLDLHGGDIHNNNNHGLDMDLSAAAAAAAAAVASASHLATSGQGDAVNQGDAVDNAAGQHLHEETSEYNAPATPVQTERRASITLQAHQAMLSDTEAASAVSTTSRRSSEASLPTTPRAAQRAAMRARTIAQKTHSTAQMARNSGYHLTVESALAKRLALEPGLRFAHKRRPSQNLNLRRRSNVEALLAHISGDEMAVPCKNCRKGHGPWTTCVVVDGQMCGSCANCWFNASGARCSFHETKTPMQGHLHAHPQRQSLSGGGGSVSTSPAVNAASNMMDPQLAAAVGPYAIGSPLGAAQQQQQQQHALSSVGAAPSASLSSSAAIQAQQAAAAAAAAAVAVQQLSNNGNYHGGVAAANGDSSTGGGGIGIGAAARAATTAADPMPLVSYVIEQALAEVRNADQRTRDLMLVEIAAKQLALAIVRYGDGAAAAAASGVPAAAAAATATAATTAATTAAPTGKNGTPDHKGEGTAEASMADQEPPHHQSAGNEEEVGGE